MRKSVLLAGLEQTGKTYFSEQYANAYTKVGGTALIYNVGKDSDFSGAEVCEPLQNDEISLYERDKIKKSLIRSTNYFQLFRDERTSKIYHFKDFCKVYKGKKVKIYRCKNERLLFKSFFMHLYSTLIILDDNRASTRHGLGHELIELCSRKNHAGVRHCGNRKQGVDLFFIYHNLDTVPGELYDYITHAVLFRLNRMPEKSHFGNPEFFEAIEGAYLRLKELPKFSRAEIRLRETDTIKTQFFTPK
jgi:hypothetical protein